MTTNKLAIIGGSGLYDVEEFKIKWPLKKVIISQKDKSAISFRDYEKKYK